MLRKLPESWRAVLHRVSPKCKPQIPEHHPSSLRRKLKETAKETQDHNSEYYQMFDCISQASQQVHLAPNSQSSLISHDVPGLKMLDGVEPNSSMFVVFIHLYLHDLHVLQALQPLRVFQKSQRHWWTILKGGDLTSVAGTN